MKMQDLQVEIDLTYKDNYASGFCKWGSWQAIVDVNNWVECVSFTVTAKTAQRAIRKAYKRICKIIER